APVRAFGEASAIPANLIYFKIEVADPGPLSLRTADGTPVAASIRTVGGDRVFAPDEAVEPGTELVLEYEASCVGETPSMPLTYAFMVDEPADVELRPAELQIAEQGVAYPGLTNNEAAFFRLRYYPPDANGAALHLMDHTATVDGKPFRVSIRGGVPMVEVSTGCLPVLQDYVQDTCGWFHAVPPGEHTVEVRSTIVGQTSQPDP